MKFKFQSGVTLIEILIVVGVMITLTAIIFGTFVSFNRNQALDKDTETIVGILREARSQTLSSQNSSHYGIHFDSNKVTLFVGSVYSPGDPANQDFNVSSSDISITPNLLGGGSDVVFKRLTGETAESGTVNVYSSTTSQTKIVTIYATGVVESN